MRIAVFGAGSLGVVLGACLTKAGLDTVLIHRNPVHVAALNRDGARVKGTVEMTVPVRAMLPDEMTGRWDLILLVTKQSENRKTAEFLKPLLSDDGIVCTLQNGLPEALLCEVLGERHVMGCTVSWGATLLEPGVSRLTSAPDSLSFGLGPIDGKWDTRCDRVKAVLENMCPVEIVPDLKSVRWSKLLINAAFSGLGTVFGCTFGEVAANPESRKICLDLIRECIDAGHKSGAEFARMQGKDIVSLFYYRNPLKRRFALVILPLAIRQHAQITPSMLQDIRKGKKTEIDDINGAVCAAGDRAGFETPINDTVVDAVHRIENGELTPGFENLRLFRK